MSAVKFKIKLEELELIDWTKWSDADQERFRLAMLKNNLECHGSANDKDTLVLRGEPQDLYWFLYDVAYNYDIELI